MDFVAAQSEAKRFRKLASEAGIQIVITTHSPSFYMLGDDGVAKYYVRKTENGRSAVVQGAALSQVDAHEGIEEGFYLPAVAEALADLSVFERRARQAESHVEQLREELAQIARPVVLTEGRTDARILRTAWAKIRPGNPPFEIRTCETGGENAGSGNGGATTLAIRIKGVAHDHPHPVLALFDLDREGIDAFKLDRNFIETEYEGQAFKRGIHGKSYAACLPIPPGREDCGEIGNIPIEFLFPDAALLAEHQGHSLKLNLMEASRKIGSETLHVPFPDETRYKLVGGGKEVFANSIVPELPAESFGAFDLVFNLIQAVFAYDAQRNEALAQGG